MNDETKKKEPSLWDVTKSVQAALFGVQSSKNYERDFQHGKASQYIIIGLIATAIFIGAIIGVVMLVLKLAGV
ncbi:MAG: DUF2970 domain-containing protein [Gammaproteobacteria bacterium]|nr:DUF2970 domain-containing protein [Gammaproteobacteria bacterium]